MQPPDPKKILRRELQARRNALDNRAARSAAICAGVIDLHVYRAARVLHCYLPIRSEVDTLPLITDALARGKGVVVPVVRPDATELDHSWVVSLAPDDLEPGIFGTRQPRHLRPADIRLCDVIIVPLLGFDRAGHRLGYGKGYYDRLLARSPATAIGVAFAAQEIDLVPRDPHDHPLDWIVTETEVIATTYRRTV